MPNGKGWGVKSPPGLAHTNARPKRGSGISYHGGPLLTNGPNVYYLWYGNWSGNTATTILTNFIKSEGGSAYFNVNTTYYDASNTNVMNIVNYLGSPGRSRSIF